MLQFVLDQLTLLLGIGRELENVNAGQMALRALLVYVCAVLLVRVGSKRLISRATAFDFIVAIMLGSILSGAINGSAPFIPTIVAGIVLVGLHWAFAVLAVRLPFVGPLVKGEPRLLIKDGQVQHDQMRLAKLSDNDLSQALHLKAADDDPSRIKRAYLERNGSISVIPFKQEPRILDVEIEDGIQIVRIKLE